MDSQSTTGRGVPLRRQAKTWRWRVHAQRVHGMCMLRGCMLRGCMRAHAQASAGAPASGYPHLIIHAKRCGCMDACMLRGCMLKHQQRCGFGCSGAALHLSTLVQRSYPCACCHSRNAITSVELQLEQASSLKKAGVAGLRWQTVVVLVKAGRLYNACLCNLSGRIANLAGWQTCLCKPSCNVGDMSLLLVSSAKLYV
eukprot:1156206-Pelagomonas_calceolata.AAC.7